MNENVLSSSNAVLRRARAVLESSGIREAWQAAGAEVNVVGSMRMGLMAVHRDKMLCPRGYIPPRGNRQQPYALE